MRSPTALHAIELAIARGLALGVFQDDGEAVSWHTEVPSLELAREQVQANAYTSQFVGSRTLS